MRARLAFAALSVLAAAGAGCASMTVPVLRHETGESLGGRGKVKATMQIESARLYPLVGADSAAVGVAQAASVFSGARVGLQGKIGFDTRLDFHLGTAFMLGGGGWNFGAKYQIIKRGKFAVAAMAGYGRYSAKSDSQYLTTGQPVDVTHTLASWVVDISVPGSVRFGKDVAIYGGPLYFRSGATGSANASYASGSAHDLGLNLGVRLGFGRVETDLEFALIRMYDWFGDGYLLKPFFGISGGVVF